MNNPLTISVVTAVFNRALTIEDTLNSVGSQDYSHVEHLVQDGGSSDGTLDIISEVSGLRTHLVSEPDNGIYDAINRGLKRATGDIVGLLHSDDTFARRDVLSHVAAAFSDPMVDCVYGDLQYVSENDPTRVVRHWKAGFYDRNNIRSGWMPPHPTFYIRRSLLEKFGSYDTSFQIAADYDAMLRWLWIHNLKPAYIPIVMVRMRTGGESNRSLGRIIKKSREDYFALRRNGVGGIPALALKNLRKIEQFKLRKPPTE
ncbi:glycosyltransferase family 2 protein [Yoonia litorea]|uniref:Glycosyltransferase n=1 Tax=Yoonia litorea TaxID=1123755 RepID=A0A1I6MVK3_9RHOB|nr:glycosyltransferase family 2 protein [Yoonia litorea]SFS19736.1 glycosyltransferase [Yoonia litorea]